MTNARLLQFAMMGFVFAMAPCSASAVTTTSASLSITSLTISSNLSFALVVGDLGGVSVSTGLDSFGNAQNNNKAIGGVVATNAGIPTASAHADANVSSADICCPTSITVPNASQTLGLYNASSSVTLTSASFSKSSGLSQPLFEAQAPTASTTNVAHFTFSMTISGLLGGSADVLGTYTSEVTALFGLQNDNPPFNLLPAIASFDQILSGGPSDNQSDIISQTLTGSFDINSSGDFFLYASTEGQSSATELGANGTPLPATLPLFATGLGGLGLLGWRKKQKAKAGSA